MFTQEQKHSIKMAALVVLFLVGVGVMGYPFVSNAIFQYRANANLKNLEVSVSQGDQKAFEEEFKKADAYNEVLVGQTVPDVFAIREGTTDQEYESFLNVRGDQTMGSVDIPVIGVHLPIYHYSTKESLAQGCGHIFGSSLPVGGTSTHAVITAHRGLPAAKLFTDLDQLEKGDRFFIKVLSRTLAYEVDNIEVVAPSETRSLAIKRGEDLVTLVTCTPYGVNTDRLLVRGHRVPYVEAEELSHVARHGKYWLHLLIEFACAVAGVGLAVGVRALLARRNEASATVTGRHVVSTNEKRAQDGTQTRAARHMASLLSGDVKDKSEKGD